MGKTPGTTLDDPVGVDHKPDLQSSLHEISEYFQEQGAYDLFGYMLKELLARQPDDPLQCMIDCLKSKHPCGPLKVIVSSAPGIGRSKLCRRLADHFGLTYIASGEILRQSGIDVNKIGMAEESQVGELVMEHLKQAQDQMQGWVLDGFPRSRIETTYLKAQSIVPTHVLVLKVAPEAILKRNQQIADGELEGEYVDPKVLETKLNCYACHSSSALEAYQPMLKTIDAMAGEDVIWQEMERTVRMLPRSTGPQRPPRVLVVGPPGTGVREHASRLAARLGAVFVDGARLMNYDEPSQSRPQSRPQSQDRPKALPRTRTSIFVPHMRKIAAEDVLGPVGVRLRQTDCKTQGFVLFGFVKSEAQAQVLAEDGHLSPTRVIALTASVETCVHRLRHLVTDPLSGKVWTTRPKSEQVRRRLVRKPEHQPAAVAAAHEAYVQDLPNILGVLGTDGRCAEVSADGNPEDVFAEIVEFVERPLPLSMEG